MDGKPSLTPFFISLRVNSVTNIKEGVGDSYIFLSFQRRAHKDLRPGDLIRVEWTDASIGKSLASGGDVDLPVRSWGIYVAVLGKKNKHLVLAQNNFQYSNGLYDVDYTSIPISWTLEITLIAKQEVSSKEAAQLLKSFLAGHCRTLKRRIRNHD